LPGPLARGFHQVVGRVQEEATVIRVVSQLACFEAHLVDYREDVREVASLDAKEDVAEVPARTSLDSAAKDISQVVHKVSVI
jgi:hypothetical protein